MGNTLFLFIVPGGLLLGATVLLVHWMASPGVLSTLAHIYPYAVYGAGILLGWQVRRSRLVFAMLLLAAVDRGLLHFAADQALYGAKRAGRNRLRTYPQGSAR